MKINAMSVCLVQWNWLFTFLSLAGEAAISSIDQNYVWNYIFRGSKIFWFYFRVYLCLPVSLPSLNLNRLPYDYSTDRFISSASKIGIFIRIELILQWSNSFIGIMFLFLYGGFIFWQLDVDQIVPITLSTCNAWNGRLISCFFESNSILVGFSG